MTGDTGEIQKRIQIYLGYIVNINSNLASISFILNSQSVDILCSSNAERKNSVRDFISKKDQL